MKTKFGQQDSSTSHRSNSDTLPSGRNPGQKSHLDISQNCVPGPGSPEPTQSSKSAPGKKGRK